MIKIIEAINVIYNLGFVINCIIILNTVKTISSIVIYNQYSFLIRSSVVSCINLYTHYKDSKREYEKLENIIAGCYERNDTKQIIEFNTITIKSLKYEYLKANDAVNKPFVLEMQQGIDLEFTRGQIIKLDGDSGHGQSTFSDIINGIIPFNEYKCDLLVDNSIIDDGFDCLNSIRYYNEQSENISWKPSVYSIVSGRDLNLDSDGNPLDSDGNPLDINLEKEEEENVWKSLEICKCGDFLRRCNDNTQDNRKWIYSYNIGMSGGQKGRIGLARTIYRIICSKPKYITLDEVDKSIQSEMVVEIMSNIFDYTRTNNIIAFVIAHNPDVKKMDFDQVIKFTNGVISK